MKTAVVTGGGHGIGRALCRRLHRDGMKVVVADIEGDAARRVAAEIDGIARELDVTDEAALVAMIDDVERDVGESGDRVCVERAYQRRSTILL